MFRKILVANRGEIALRVIRTCREMGIKTVAVYSTADKESLHVRFADEAVCIGPPASAQGYLNIPKIIAAAEITNADAVHPGYGFLSENAEFSQVCQENRLAFIGPTAEMIVAMGDKASAKRNMVRAGVPTVPGSEGVVSSLQEAKHCAEQIGYPVLLKATAGGGGKGMRAVPASGQFESAWKEAKMEAKASFGNDGIYIEKLIEEPRHIEFQVLGDKYGHVCHLSERDCSIQRRHQKLVEETPSPFFDKRPELRDKMGEAAVKGAASIGYEGCGTIEFLVDKHGEFYFMEMNTRIQVEHPVTEEVTGLDLIREQIRVASGEKCSDKAFYPTRCAMECRINAEDPIHDFRPSPGEIEHLHLPGGRNVRVDTHIYAGYTVPPFYDSMIAKLIVSGETRKEVIQRMQRSLDEFVVEGIRTTIPFHQKLMQHARFQSGDFSTKFLEDFRL